MARKKARVRARAIARGEKHKVSGVLLLSLPPSPLYPSQYKVLASKNTARRTRYPPSLHSTPLLLRHRNRNNYLFLGTLRSTRRKHRRKFLNGRCRCASLTLRLTLSRPLSLSLLPSFSHSLSRSLSRSLLLLVIIDVDCYAIFSLAR